MPEIRELCWLTTTRCNQSCKYCHRFINKKNLNKGEYMQVVKKLIDYGVRNLTFGGGEALLVENFAEIVDIAYAAGVKLKLVTNGTLLLEEANRNIVDKMSIITLSIDSISDFTNEMLGRGSEHFGNIKKALDMLKELKNGPQIVINSVATRINLGDFNELAGYISAYPIKHWRIFRFCPLRESAVKNREMFEIVEEEFIQLRHEVEGFHLPFSVDYRNYDEMGKNYLLITPDGYLCVSNNLDDKVVGSIIEDDLINYFT